MKIDVRIRKVFFDYGKLKALLSITLDGQIAIHDIKIIQRNDGSLFVAMPSRKDENNTYRNIIHPINSETRRQIEDAVFRAYSNHSDPLPF